MDYKEIFLASYDTTFHEQENKVYSLLKEFKNEDIFEPDHYCNKIHLQLMTNISEFEKNYPFNLHYDYLDLFESKKEIKKDPIQNILKLRIKPKFENEIVFGLDSFEHFIKILANYIALIDVKKFYENYYWLTLLYFEFDELEKFKLEKYRNIKTHPDYIRLTEIKYHSIELMREQPARLDTSSEENSSNKTLKNCNQHNRDRIEDLITKLEMDEKLLMLSELLSMPTKDRSDIPDTEVARVLYITEGVLDSRLFTEKSKNLDYLTKFRQGLYYHKNKLKRQQIIDNINYKTTEFKINKFRTYLTQLLR